MIPQEVKEDFLRQLEYHTVLYKIIGMGTHESPMWFQLTNLIGKTDHLTFQSSQRDIRFIVPVSDEVIEYVRYNTSEAYNYFRDLKYEYLKNNHPLVYSEIK